MAGLFGSAALSSIGLGVHGSVGNFGVGVPSPDVDIAGESDEERRRRQALAASQRINPTTPGYSALSSVNGGMARTAAGAGPSILRGFGI